MSDLSSNVTWKEILRETDAGNIPHCRAIAAPKKFHDEIIITLAKIIIANYRPSHPDIIMIGESDKAPNIDACRELISEIALKPLEANKRLGIITNADKLLLPAANSLLKLTEEPPAHAYLLFVMEDGKLFLPTLKSRSRYSVINISDRAEPKPMPRNASEWLSWLGENSKKGAELENVVNDLEAWGNFALNEKNFALAYKLDTLRVTANKKNLSMPLLCDMILMLLREENTQIEDILNDIREA